jgi:hypothetical protein
MPFTDKLRSMVESMRGIMNRDAEKASANLRDHADRLIAKVRQDLDHHLDRRIAEQEKLAEQAGSFDAYTAPPVTLAPAAKASDEGLQQPVEDDAWVVSDEGGTSEPFASGVAQEESENPAPAAEAAGPKKKPSPAKRAR